MNPGWEELERPSPQRVVVGGVQLSSGSRVRVEPRSRGDALTASLAGRAAIVESVEQDMEDRVLLAVRLEDDPGRDLGRGRQIGHRFYVSPEEVTPLEGTGAPTVLVAGLGDAFRGDAGFGCRVVGELSDRPVPPGVEVSDFGIRRRDLTYALDDGHAAVILVEAVAGEEPPGTLSVAESPPGGAPNGVFELRCSIREEEAASPELSPPVEAAVGRAVEQIEAMLSDLVPSERREGAVVE